MEVREFISASARTTGFSLMELIIVFAMVGILAAIALPSYNESIERTSRTDCNRYLLTLASKQARFYTSYSSYTNILKASAGCSAGDCGLNLSTDKNGQNTCTVTVHTRPHNCGPTTDPFTPCTGFTLLGNLHRDKKCATVSIDNIGQKQATATGDFSLTDDALVDFCWR